MILVSALPVFRSRFSGFRFFFHQRFYFLPRRRCFLLLEIIPPWFLANWLLFCLILKSWDFDHSILLETKELLRRCHKSKGRGLKIHWQKRIEERVVRVWVWLHFLLFCFKLRIDYKVKRFDLRKNRTKAYYKSVKLLHSKEYRNAIRSPS